MGVFDSAKELPPDAIFGLVQTFKEDTRQHKIDLMVGVFRNENLECVEMNVVQKAARQLLQCTHSPNYLSFFGDPNYLNCTSELMFGKERYQRAKNRIIASQGIGGTGTLYAGALLLKKMGCQTIYFPEPTWPNHDQIMTQAGLKIKSYPYFDIPTGKLLFNEMLMQLEKINSGDVVLLQTSCHNPSGYDLSLDQWKEVSHVLKQRGGIAFFDTAYQGFKQTLDDDVAAVRLFVDEGHDFLSTQSFSKNFSLYCERISTLYVVFKDASLHSRIASNLRLIIRSIYSNPPRYGQAIIQTILSDEELREEWKKELATQRDRLNTQRQILVHKLSENIPSKDWSSLIHTSGMFLFIGLDINQVKRLREEHAIYMTGKGRINLSGLNNTNIDRVVLAIKEVMK